MKKLFKFIMLLMVPWLVLGGLAGGLFAAGVLNKQKADSILKILKGEPTATVGAEQMTREDMIALGKDLDKKREQLRKEEENFKQIRDVRNARQKDHDKIENHLAGQLQKITERSLKLDEREKLFEQRIKEYQEAMAAADFKIGVSNFEGMSSKKAARILYDMEDAEILRYLRAMKKSTASEIVAAITKIDDEKKQVDDPEGPDGGSNINRGSRLQKMLSGKKSLENDKTAEPK